MVLGIWSLKRVSRPGNSIGRNSIEACTWGQFRKTLVPQPSPESAAHPPESPIVIQLSNVNASQRPILKINQEEVSWDGLEARLTAVYKQREDKVAFVKGDPDVEFEYVAEAIDITHRAGAERIGLLGSQLSTLPDEKQIKPGEGGEL